MVERSRLLSGGLAFAGAFVICSSVSYATATPPTPMWAPVSTLVAATYADNTYGTPLESSIVGMPGGGATAVWGNGSNLEAATRTSKSPTFSSPVTIATNGSFLMNDEGTAPNLAVSPSGQVTVAWVAAQGGGPGTAGVIDVSTRAAAATTWSTPVSVSATGDSDSAPVISYGQNGTAVVAWQGSTSISAAVLAPDATAWTAPVVVSDPVGTDALPPVQDAQVAVADSGDVTVAWNSYETNPKSGGSNYRLRTSTRSAATTKWTTPTWLSDDGVSPPVRLVAGTDGTVAASWSDNKGPQVSILSGTGWSDPAQVTGPASYPPFLIAGPKGVLTAVFLSAAVGHDQLLAASYTPAQGWSSPVTVDPDTDNDGISGAQLTVDGAGAVTATWLRYTGTVWQFWSSTSSTSQSWAPPAADAINSTDVSDFNIAEDPSGLRTVVFNDQVRERPTQTLTQYALEAAGTVLPSIAPVTAPRITGTVGVGHRLTASSGSWTPTASSYTYTWRRDGAAINSATSSTFTPTIADATQEITVTVVAHRSGYQNGTSTSAAVTVPRPTIVNTATPTIGGRPHVNVVLKAQAGRWSPAATKYTYQWLRSGHAIRGATRSSYRVVNGDRHHTIAVRVTAARAGYTAAARSSKNIRIT